MRAKHILLHRLLQSAGDQRQRIGFIRRMDSEFLRRGLTNGTLNYLPGDHLRV